MIPVHLELDHRPEQVQIGDQERYNLQTDQDLVDLLGFLSEPGQDDEEDGDSDQSDQSDIGRSVLVVQSSEDRW